MRESAFRSWLSSRYSQNSANSRFSCAKRVEEKYGDLDDWYERNAIDELLGKLHYTQADFKASKPNPTLLNINGNPYNVLNNFKTGVRSYQKFLDEGGELELETEVAIEKASASIAEKKEGKQFELERHLQESLRAEIQQLELGLAVVDGGSELTVPSGDIDILAQDADGALVVIELKRGVAKREAIGQITGYMGDLIAEDNSIIVRGILVAGDLDKSCKSAVRAIPKLILKRYRYSFAFEDIE